MSKKFKIVVSIDEYQSDENGELEFESGEYFEWTEFNTEEEAKDFVNRYLPRKDRMRDDTL